MSFYAVQPLAIQASIAAMYSITTPVKSIIFDFGGVLVKPDEDRLITYLANSFKVSENEIRALQVKDLQWIRVNEIEFGIWKKFAKERFNLDLSNTWRQDYEAEKIKAVKELPGIRELLNDLRNKGYTLEMLSNFEEWMEPFLDRFGYRDQNLFSHLYLSYKIKKEKPSLDAYEYVLSDLKLQGNETIFIDDQFKNIEAAQKLGIDAIHFTSAERLRKDLVTRGIL
jgi:HAD superfamily hydrolase (TIGR01509 family)